MAQQQVTREVFEQHLRARKHHDDFAEDGDALMRKLADLKIPRTRGRTHAFGFVIPCLDDHTRKEILKLLHPRKWIATINTNAKIKVGECVYTYTHIKIDAHS